MHSHLEQPFLVRLIWHPPCKIWRIPTGCANFYNMSLLTKKNSQSSFVLAQYFTHRDQIIVQHLSGRLLTCQRTLREQIAASKRPLGSYWTTGTWLYSTTATVMAMATVMARRDNQPAAKDERHQLTTGGWQGVEVWREGWLMTGGEGDKRRKRWWRRWQWWWQQQRVLILVFCTSVKDGA